MDQIELIWTELNFWIFIIFIAFLGSFFFLFFYFIFLFFIFYNSKLKILAQKYNKFHTFQQNNEDFFFFFGTELEKKTYKKNQVKTQSIYY